MDQSLNWKAIYILPRKVTLDSFTRVFQFKVLHNFLYLNDKLFKFGLVSSPLCSFCNASNETPEHLFSLCVHTQSLWLQFKTFFESIIDLPDLLPQTAILGFFNIDYDYALINHLLLIFKQYLYNSRSKVNPSLAGLLFKIKKVKEIEMTIADSNPMRSKLIHKKWQKIAFKLDQF